MLFTIVSIFNHSIFIFYHCWAYPVHSGMHVFSIVFLHFRMAFVYAAAFNPLWCPHARTLSQSQVTQMNISQAWNPSRQVCLEVKPSYWSSPNAFGLLGNRQSSSHVYKRSSTPAEGLDTRPTPPPTGDPSPTMTVHITDENDFSLIAPGNSQELISEAEADGVSFCTAGSSSTGCSRRLNDGFVTAAAMRRSDDGAYIQITGCFDPSKFPMSTTDDGGQYDVRFPNGAQCTFGGYGASFIEQIEPSAKRFCLRCCASENDQTNCNSHQDRAGCPTAIPGVYTFPNGVTCE